MTKKAEGGLFITFEGGDGVGKSTQIKRLAEQLEERGHTVVLSREPGGTPGAEAIRHVILSARAAEPFGPACEALMFAAARNDHVQQIIRPAVQRGDIVLVDRYMDSTRVYQGISGDLDDNFVQSVERVAIDNMVPDLTILLDMPHEIGIERMAKRQDQNTAPDRFESEDTSQQKRRRDAFLKLAKSEPDRIKIVDAQGSVEQISADILALVEPLLKARTGKADA